MGTLKGRGVQQKVVTTNLRISKSGIYVASASKVAEARVGRVVIQTHAFNPSPGQTLQVAVSSADPITG